MAMGTAPKPAPPATQPAIEPPRWKLTHHDRCDAKGCGAQAYIRATLATGELLFCGHHGQLYAPKLKPLAIVWLDERAQISTERAGI